MQTNKTVDCENLVQNNQISVAKHSVRPNRHLNKMCLLKPTDTTDIVFSNQTDKLFKKQQSLHPSKSTPVMGKYNLRKKSVQTRSDIKKPNQQTCDKHLRGLKDEQSRPKKRNAQLSKYKRKNANARERDRVKVSLSYMTPIWCHQIGVQSLNLSVGEQLIIFVCKPTAGSSLFSNSICLHSLFFFFK